MLSRSFDFFLRSLSFHSGHLWSNSSNMLSSDPLITRRSGGLPLLGGVVSWGNEVVKEGKLVHLLLRKPVRILD